METPSVDMQINFPQALVKRVDFKGILPETFSKCKLATSIVATNIPEAVLTGGMALRLHLEQKGKPIPNFPKTDDLDLDFLLKPDHYDSIRDTFRNQTVDREFIPKHKFAPTRQELLHQVFIRKDEKLDKTDRHLSMKTRDQRCEDVHVDFDSSDYVEYSPLVSIDINSERKKATQVFVLTPEELFYRRFLQVFKMVESSKSASQVMLTKVLRYLYLNSQIIDHLKMDEFWKKKIIHQPTLTQNRNWKEVVESTLVTLDSAVKRGKIIFEDRGY